MADALDPRLPPAPPLDPVAEGFRDLMAIMVQAGTQQSDAGNEAGFQRAFAYRGAIRRLHHRWSAGDASPVRSAPTNPTRRTSKKKDA